MVKAVVAATVVETVVTKAIDVSEVADQQARFLLDLGPVDNKRVAWLLRGPDHK